MQKGIISTTARDTDTVRKVHRLGAYTSKALPVVDPWHEKTCNLQKPIHWHSSRFLHGSLLFDLIIMLLTVALFG